MSVRSFCWSLIAVVGVIYLFGSATPVLADACSFGCSARYSASGASDVRTSCTADRDCAAMCTATCNSLTSPRALVDNAHPSTCPAGALRICTPCTCIPQGAAGNECVQSTGATTCRARCGEVCSGYNARRDVINVTAIVCPAESAPAAPTCAAAGGTGVSAPGSGARAPAGFCRYACSFGATRPIRTSVSCTPSSPSECAADLSADCGVNGLDPMTPRPPAICTPGEGGNKCVITCNRRTAVTESERGTCATGTAGTGVCTTRCQTVCTGRGMVCNTTTAPACTSGNCAFSCAVAPVSAPIDDQAATCDGTPAATQLCTSRCTASCYERGGTCTAAPAPSCVTSGGTRVPGGADSAPPPGGGTNSSSDSQQSARTAPVFRVSFPDPFGGRLTLQEIIGSIIRIMIGLCGLFFLGVFVYGGILYLTSSGDPTAVKKGRESIVNAVIGLVIVLFSYTAVSLIVQLSGQFQSTGIGEVDQSQNALDDDSTVLRPGGSTRATGRSSQGTETPAPGGTTTPAPQPEAGTPEAACRSYYRADPATCRECPRGVSDLGGLITAWGRSFPAATTAVPNPAASCRTCLENGIRGLVNRNPGLTTSCIPALVNLWNTACHEACNPRSSTGSGRETSGDDLCNPTNYNVAAPGCARCRTYWGQDSRRSTIEAVGCPELAGKVLVWCAGSEAPPQTRPQSDGYCVFTASRR